MNSDKNIIAQQVKDFLCRARQKLGELATIDPSGDECPCTERLMGDLYAAIKTLTNCRSGLTWAEQQRLVELVTSRASLGQLHRRGGGCGVIVRRPGCGFNTGNIILPLTGEQVTVRVDGHTRNLQNVITDLYSRATSAQVYCINGGSASANFHPSVINR